MGLHQSSPNKQLSTMKKCQHQQEINEVDSLMERSTEERDANIVQVISEHEEQLSTSLTELTSTNSPAQTTGGGVGRNVIERVTVHIQVPHWPTTASTFFYEKDTKLKYAFRDYAKFQLIRCSCILRFSINGVEIDEDETIAALEQQKRIYIEQNTVSFETNIREGYENWQNE